jgi:hypothetical protein
MSLLEKQTQIYWFGFFFKFNFIMLNSGAQAACAVCARLQLLRLHGQADGRA